MKIRFALCFALGVAFLSSAHAQNWPSKPVRLVVPYAAGGPYDELARLLGPHLTEIWKQPVVVDNRGGAGGNIGADAVAKAPPDGYTLLLGNAGPITINPSLHKKMPYDAQRDFAPLALIGSVPMVLAVPGPRSTVTRPRSFAGK
mgnify:CR=1 FL=1